METMEHQPLVIIGSSRKQGDTHALVENTMAGMDYRLADLLDYSIAPYNYQHTYPAGDTFGQLVDLLLRHQTVVLATPVYWYSMSGLMKNFFDRLTDLIRLHKPLGRRLKGKSVFVLVAGNNQELPPGFLIPFERSCEYLDMHFSGSLYHSTESPLPAPIGEQQIAAFRTELLHSQQARQA